MNTGNKMKISFFGQLGNHKSGIYKASDFSNRPVVIVETQ